MLMTNVLKPQQAQPRDLSNRLLQRLYPGDYGQATAPKSPTGLPISTPPPPAPALSRAGMAQPSYAPNAAAPAPVPAQAPAAPQSGGLSGLIPRPAAGSQGDTYSDLTEPQRQQLNDYWKSLAGIDYKGSHESALLQHAALAQLMRSWNMEAPLDYTGAAPIADQFQNSRNALEAGLAARGINGPAVGGALSNSYSQEARGIGDYIRQLTQQREAQHHSDYQDFLNWARGLQTMGLQANIQKQNSPGFFDELLGIGGSLVGGLLPHGGRP